MEYYNLKNKKALITGGTHGIGLAIAKELFFHGCSIAVCSRSNDRLKETQTILNQKS